MRSKMLPLGNRCLVLMSSSLVSVRREVVTTLLRAKERHQRTRSSLISPRRLMPLACKTREVERAIERICGVGPAVFPQRGVLRLARGPWHTSSVQVSPDRQHLYYEDEKTGEAPNGCDRTPWDQEQCLRRRSHSVLLRHNRRTTFSCQSPLPFDYMTYDFFSR